MSFELTRRLHTGHAVVMDRVVPKNSQTGPNQRVFFTQTWKFFAKPDQTQTQNVFCLKR